MDASMVSRAFDQINQNFVFVRVATFRNDIDQVGQSRTETIRKQTWRVVWLTLVVSSVRIVPGDWRWRSLRKSSKLVYWFYLRVRPESNSSPNSRTFPFLEERSFVLIQAKEKCQASLPPSGMESLMAFRNSRMIDSTLLSTSSEAKSKTGSAPWSRMNFSISFN